MDNFTLYLDEFEISNLYHLARSELSKRPTHYDNRVLKSVVSKLYEHHKQIQLERSRERDRPYG